MTIDMFDCCPLESAKKKDLYEVGIYSNHCKCLSSPIDSYNYRLLQDIDILVLNEKVDNITKDYSINQVQYNLYK